MIINIKRNQNEKQLEELKYNFILKNNNREKIDYNWNLKGEYPGESFEDFHLFCISIVKDLLEKNIKINEDDENHSYNFDEDNFDIESTLEDLGYLYSIIAHKKLKSI